MSKKKNGAQKKDRCQSPPAIVPNPHKFRIIQKYQGKVVVEIDEKYFESMLNCLQNILIDLRPFGGSQQNLNFNQEIDNTNSSNQISEAKSKVLGLTDVREAQDFRRRIPHFFMGRFKKWAKLQNESEIHQFLQDLQSRKKSKQGRFELGDFHKTFIVDPGDLFPVQMIKAKIKNMFIDFLQNEAVLQIIQYNKIKTKEQKIKYIDMIPDMVFELVQEKPFEQFLAQENIQKAMDKNKAYDQVQTSNPIVNQDIPKSPFN